MNAFFALLSGLIFGIGLIVAGMANPAKVLGFLDLAGLWDPSLALVMGGAIAVGSAAIAFAKSHTTSFIGLPLQWPTATVIDRRLIGGSALFGVGWGLAGLCPGPGLVTMASGEFKAGVCVLAMVGGMMLFEAIERAVSRKARTLRG